MAGLAAGAPRELPLGHYLVRVAFDPKVEKQSGYLQVEVGDVVEVLYGTPEEGDAWGYYVYGLKGNVHGWLPWLCIGAQLHAVYDSDDEPELSRPLGEPPCVPPPPPEEAPFDVAANGEPVPPPEGLAQPADGLAPPDGPAPPNGGLAPLNEGLVLPGLVPPNGLAPSGDGDPAPTARSYLASLS